MRAELQAYDREMAAGSREPDLALSKRFVSVYVSHQPPCAALSHDPHATCVLIQRGSFGHLDGMLPVVWAHWKQAEEKGLKADIDLCVLSLLLCPY